MIDVFSIKAWSSAIEDFLVRIRGNWAQKLAFLGRLKNASSRWREFHECQWHPRLIQ